MASIHSTMRGAHFGQDTQTRQASDQTAPTPKDIAVLLETGLPEDIKARLEQLPDRKLDLRGETLSRNALLQLVGAGVPLNWLALGNVAGLELKGLLGNLRKLDLSSAFDPTCAGHGRNAYLLPDDVVNALAEFLSTVHQDSNFQSVVLDWNALTEKQKNELARYAPTFDRGERERRAQVPTHERVPEVVVYVNGPKKMVFGPFGSADAWWKTLLKSGDFVSAHEDITHHKLDTRLLDLTDTPCSDLMLATLGEAVKQPNCPLTIVRLGKVDARGSSWLNLLSAVATAGTVGTLDLVALQVQRPGGYSGARVTGAPDDNSALDDSDIDALAAFADQFARNNVEVRLNSSFVSSAGRQKIRDMQKSGVEIHDVHVPNINFYTSGSEAAEIGLKWARVLRGRDDIDTEVSHPAMRAPVLDLSRHDLNGSAAARLLLLLAHPKCPFTEVKLGRMDDAPTWPEVLSILLSGKFKSVDFSATQLYRDFNWHHLIGYQAFGRKDLELMLQVLCKCAKRPPVLVIIDSARFGAPEQHALASLRDLQLDIKDINEHPAPKQSPPAIEVSKQEPMAAPAKNPEVSTATDFRPAANLATAADRFLEERVAELRKEVEKGQSANLSTFQYISLQCQTAHKRLPDDLIREMLRICEPFATKGHGDERRLANTIKSMFPPQSASAIEVSKQEPMAASATNDVASAVNSRPGASAAAERAKLLEALAQLEKEVEKGDQANLDTFYDVSVQYRNARKKLPEGLIRNMLRICEPVATGPRTAEQKLAYAIKGMFPRNFWYSAK